MYELRSDLESAAAITDRADRTVRVAAVLSEALGAAGALPVLVGGGAVEIYTRSAYTTHDLDFVAAMTPAVEKVLNDLGFERDGRHWLHVPFGLALEFPGTTIAPASSVSMRVGDRRLEIISVEDLIVDRLASWKYWGWDPDGAAAVLLIAAHADLEQARLETRAEQEEVGDALRILRPLAYRGEPVTSRQLRELRSELGRR